MFVRNKDGVVHSVPDAWAKPQLTDQFGKALVPSRLQELALVEATAEEAAAWRDKYEPKAVVVPKGKEASGSEVK